MPAKFTKPRTPNSSSVGKLINETIIPNSKTIFLSEKRDDKKYLATGLIIEKTLRYLIKQRDRNFQLRGVPVNKLIIKSNEFQDFPKKFGSFLSEYWDRRNYEVHEKPIVLNQIAINKLRTNMHRYLDWFFKKVLLQPLIPILNNWGNVEPPIIAKIREQEQKSKGVSKPSTPDTRIHADASDKIPLDIPAAKPADQLKLLLNDNKGFTRTYYKNIIIDKNQLRGIKLPKSKQDLSGLHLDIVFQESNLIIVNKSEKLKILFNDKTLVRNRKKNIPEGVASLAVEGIKLKITLNKF